MAHSVTNHGTLSQYHRLNVPVWASDRTVIRAARGLLNPAFLHLRGIRANRHGFYRGMLEHHRKAWDLYVAVQRGLY